MNKFFNRPISPHLSIYKPQISSLFSIWHRLTAVYIFVYFVTQIFLYKIMLMSYFTNYYFNNYFFHVSFILNYLLFVSLCYHFLNGTKYIFWSLNFFLSKIELTKFSVGICISMISLQIFFFKNYFI